MKRPILARLTFGLAEEVRAHNVATGLDRNTRTDQTGEYSIPLLAIGEYTLTVEATGFKTGAVRGIVPRRQVSHQPLLRSGFLRRRALLTIGATAPCWPLPLLEASLGGRAGPSSITWSSSKKALISSGMRFTSV